MTSILGRIVLLIVVFLGLSIGGLLLYFGWQQRQLFVKCAPTPVTVSLDDLVRRGASDNVHFQVTDFIVGFKFVTKENRNGKVTRAWIPLFSPNAAGDPRKIKVVLITSRLTGVSDQELTSYRDKTVTVTGLIINDVQSLGKKERGLLEDYYTDADFSDVLLLDEGREPPSAGLVYGLLGGGAGLVFVAGVCGVLVLIGALRRPRPAAARKKKPRPDDEEEESDENAER